MRWGEKEDGGDRIGLFPSHSFTWGCPMFVQGREEVSAAVEEEEGRRRESVLGAERFLPLWPPSDLYLPFKAREQKKSKVSTALSTPSLLPIRRLLGIFGSKKFFV